MVGISILRPFLLVLLLLLPALALAWFRWPPPIRGRRSRLALGARLLLVTLLVLALAGPRVNTQPHSRALVAVVDVSDSVRSAGGLQQQEDAVRQLASAKGPDDLFGVVTFAHDAAVELPLSRRPEIEPGYHFQTQPDPSFTDIAGALRLAAGLVPDGFARHLVLISDGRQNLGDATAAVAALRATGVRVDVFAVGAEPGAEALVSAVEMPAEVREGQAPSATVRLRSTGPAAGKITLFIDNRELTSREVALPAGSSAQTFQLPGLEAGLHRVRAELAAQPDTFAENNVGEAVVRVRGRPLVLVLEGGEGEGENVAAALAAAGLGVERRAAAAAPTDSATLGRYESTVIVDAPADGFPRDALSALAASVRELGRGLVAIGGPTSYGPGGWQGTPLEEALPVRMEIPKRKDRPKVAVVLVMESMEDPRADQVVLGAAEQVIDKLTPEDEVAVTDGHGGFLVELTPVRDKRAIQARLEGGNLGDPPSYLPFVEKAVEVLGKSDAQLKHIVVLGDGDAEETVPDRIRAVLEAAAGRGITTSAIGVDVHGHRQYMAYMQDIARWGGGRFYESNNPSQVPQLFLKESIASLRPWFEQEPFHPQIGAAGDLLAGVPTGEFPELGGYVVTTARPAAEQYLLSPKRDPVLASWTYGLGRAVAWTSDSTGLWSAGLLRSPAGPVLLARMAAWSLPGETGGRLRIESRPSGDGLEVKVSDPESAAGSVQLGVIGPDLRGAAQEMLAVAPGRWQGRVSGATVGIYLLRATLRRGGAVVAVSEAAVAVPYSSEYLELGRDEALLAEVARAGSGVRLGRPALAWAQRPLPVPVATDLFWVLLLVTACLWPLDVALRRLTLSPRQLAAAMVALARGDRRGELELAPPESLVRLRRRVSGARARARSRPEPADPGLLTSERESAAAPPAEEPAPAHSSPAPPPAVTDEEALSARLLEARRRRRGQGD